MTPIQFRHWRKSHKWTQLEAGKALGLSQRTVVRLEREGPIPEYLALACATLTAHLKTEKSNPRPATTYELLQEQHPDLALEYTALLLPYEAIRGTGYGGVVQAAFSDDALDWIAETSSSASLTSRSVVFDNETREIAIVTFSSISDAVSFKLRWA